jgi:hypothetical protein
MGYLSIWELDHVLHPEFFSEIPLAKWKVRDNKLVYYILMDRLTLVITRIFPFDRLTLTIGLNMVRSFR